MSRSINSAATTKNTVKAYSSQSFNVPGNSFKFIAVTDSDDEFLFAGQLDNEIYVPKSGKPAILSESAIKALDNGASMDDMKVLCSVTRLQVSRLVNEPFSVKFYIYVKNENTSNVKKLNKDILDMMFAEFDVEKAETVKPEFSENGKKYLESENTLFTQEELIYKFFNRYVLKAKVETPVVETTEEKKARLAAEKKAAKEAAGK